MNLTTKINAVCGLYLIVIVLIISVICGGTFLVNPFVFLIGYYACFFGDNVKKVREKFSQGGISKKQIKMIYFSIAALFILMFCIAGPFIPGWHWRQIWLGVLMATAVHFFLEPVWYLDACRSRGRFFAKRRQFFAVILYVFQEKLPKCGGKDASEMRVARY